MGNKQHRAGFSPFDVLELNHIPCDMFIVPYRIRVKRNAFVFISYVHSFIRSFTSPPFQLTTAESRTQNSTKVGEILFSMNEIRYCRWIAICEASLCSLNKCSPNTKHNGKLSVNAELYEDIAGESIHINIHTHKYICVPTHAVLVLFPYCRGVLNQNRNGIRYCVA